MPSCTRCLVNNLRNHPTCSRYGDKYSMLSANELQERNLESGSRAWLSSLLYTSNCCKFHALSNSSWEWILLWDCYSNVYWSLWSDTSCNTHCMTKHGHHRCFTSAITIAQHPIQKVFAPGVCTRVRCKKEHECHGGLITGGILSYKFYTLILVEFLLWKCIVK